MAGISAYRWLRNDRAAEVMASLKTGIYLAALLIPLQIVAGDFHGLNTLEHQPAKLAAMEGIWQTQTGVPAVLFALPDEKAKENRYEISIPKLASFYLTHSLDGEVKGLNEFEGKHPPVAPVFWAFRIMVGMGLLMLAVSWTSVLQLAPWKKDPSRTLKTWLVSGVLTAADAVSQVVAPKIALTFSLYLALYAALLVAYVSVIFYLARHRTHADKPFDAGMEDTLNPVNYPDTQAARRVRPAGASHA